MTSYSLLSIWFEISSVNPNEITRDLRSEGTKALLFLSARDEASKQLLELLAEQKRGDPIIRPIGSSLSPAHVLLFLSS